LSTVFVGQAVGLKEVQDDIWLVSFMDYDLGDFDLEARVLKPLDNPFGPRLSPMQPVHCVTYVSGPDPVNHWRVLRDLTPDPLILIFPQTLDA